MVYEFLEHTADEYVKCTADNFTNALIECANCLIDLCKRPKTASKQFIYKRISSSSKEYLVVDLLSYLLELMDSGTSIFSVDLISLSSLTYIVKIRAGEQYPEVAIKAITYHNLRVEQAQDCSIYVVFDV